LVIILLPINQNFFKYYTSCLAHWTLKIPAAASTPGTLKEDTAREAPLETENFALWPHGRWIASQPLFRSNNDQFCKMSPKIRKTDGFMTHNRSIFHIDVSTRRYTYLSLSRTNHWLIRQFRIPRGLQYNVDAFANRPGKWMKYSAGAFMNNKYRILL
jgi:hypothetical protein